MKVAGFPGCIMELLVQGSKWGKRVLVHLAKAILQVEISPSHDEPREDIHVKNYVKNSQITSSKSPPPATHQEPFLPAEAVYYIRKRTRTYSGKMCLYSPILSNRTLIHLTFSCSLSPKHQALQWALRIRQWEDMVPKRPRTHNQGWETFFSLKKYFSASVYQVLKIWKQTKLTRSQSLWNWYSNKETQVKKKKYLNN